MHGRLGEDGAMQGVLETLNIPYVGTGVLGSALGMNKVIAKQLVSNCFQIAVVPYLYFNSQQWHQHSLDYIIQIE